MKSHEEEKKRKERQLKMIHDLATWLPWISVLAVLIATLLMIFWALFMGSSIYTKF